MRVEPRGSVKHVAFGMDRAFVVLYDDGAYVYNGVNRYNGLLPALGKKTLAAVYLSPFDEDYFILYDDGTNTYWCDKDLHE